MIFLYPHARSLNLEFDSNPRRSMITRQPQKQNNDLRHLIKLTGTLSGYLAMMLLDSFNLSSAPSNQKKRKQRPIKICVHFVSAGKKNQKTEITNKPDENWSLNDLTTIPIVDFFRRMTTITKLFFFSFFLWWFALVVCEETVGEKDR